jgi:hypothetical protein
LLVSSMTVARPFAHLFGADPELLASSSRRSRQRCCIDTPVARLVIAIGIEAGLRDSSRRRSP